MAGVFRKVYSFIRKDFWRKMIALFFALMIYAVVQDLQQDGRRPNWSVSARRNSG